jgi:hypothetical protein
MSSGVQQQDMTIDSHQTQQVPSINQYIIRDAARNMGYYMMNFFMAVTMSGE